MLDNLGIMIDTNKVYQEYADNINKTVSELTDQEKKTAFVEGALASAKDMVEDLGDEQLDTRDTINQMNVAFSDLSITLGNKLSPATKASAGAMTLFVRQIDDALTFFDRLEEASRAWVLMEDGETAIMNLRKELETMTKPEITARMEEIAEKSAKIGQFGDADQAQTLVTMFQMLQEALPNAFDGLSDFDMKYNEFVETQKGAVTQYELEQEMIAKLMSDEGYPGLAEKLGLVTDEQKNLNDEKDKTKRKSQQETEQLLKDRKKVMESQVANFKAMHEAGIVSEKAAKRVAQTQATVDMYASATAAYKAMVGIPLVGPTLAVAAAASAVAAGVANIRNIEKAQYGMDEVVNKPTLILAGEAGAEQVSITPLEGENRDGPQGGGGVNLTLNSPIMTKDFVEGELAEAIKTASRQGVDFGV